MSGHTDRRYVGIVGDGGTDREIVAQVARMCLGSPCEIIDLRRQSLRDSIDEYWKLKKGDDDGAAENGIVKAVLGVLVAALGDFEARIPRAASSSDVLVLSSDSERYFRNEAQYFEPWAWSLISSAYLGIERFVQAQVGQGRSWSIIPRMALFIPFPSTDVLVAGIRREAFRGMKALELKQLLYGTTNLNELGPEELNEQALMFIEQKSLADAFRLIPEARNLLTTLGASYL
jgi:hypothetical protein